MQKTVVLAEKPSVGRDIAKVLNCTKQGNKCYENDRYIVTWALGHLVTLAAPEAYDPKYEQWVIEDLPMLPEVMRLETIRQTAGHFKAVKAQLVRSDVKEIVIATDAGREGELVARWILDKAHVRKPIKRLWISSVTDKAIREGFERLKDGHAYDALYAAAQARSEADWYVGMNATRALTCKFNAQLSCGRVQTPTLAMIDARETAIRAFVPKPFYGLKLKVQGTQLTWRDMNGQAHSFDKAYVEGIMAQTRGLNATIQTVDRQRKHTSAPGLYDLTTLQSEANKRFGFSAKHTLNLAQRLYETHKILTYPRTDSSYISEDIVETLPERLAACGLGEMSKLASKLSRQKLTMRKSFVNGSKVTDHHAIIPTEQTVFGVDLSSDERKLYDLVVSRFLAVLMPDFSYDETRVTMSVGKAEFTVKGRTVHDLGWKAVYQRDASDDDDEVEGDNEAKNQLPFWQKGDSFPVLDITMTQGATQPPRRFTEGTLLEAMANPMKGLEGGIGTVATRADIIEKLLSSFLIEARGQELTITTKGKQLLTLVPESLKSPKLTMDWEVKLSQIEKGQLSKQAFIREIIKFTQTNVSDIIGSEQAFKHDNLTHEKCPECGKLLLQVNGKKGKMLVCQDRECGYRKRQTLITNARCPNCHKKMTLVGSDDQKLFTCSCGHREKQAQHKERVKEASKQGRRADVQRYMAEQKKNTSPLSTLGDALAKWQNEEES